MSIAGFAERLPRPMRRVDWDAIVKGLAGLAFGLAVYAITDTAFVDKLLYILLLAMVAISVNFTHSATGELALGQVGVFASGAYFYAVCTSHYGWNVWLALIFGTVCAGLIGLLAALPSLRIGSWYFALTSLFIAVVIPDVVKLMPSLTGGADGLGGIAPLTIGGRVLGIRDMYLLALVVVALLIVMLRILTRSRFGLAFDSMRRSTVFAASLGIPILRTKAISYGFASLIAGFAGTLFAASSGYVSPDAFPISLSILIVAGVVVGGQETVVGPVVGVALLQLLPDYTSAVNKYSLLLYGGILIFVMLLIPQGLVPTVVDGLRRLLPAAWRSRAVATAPEIAGGRSAQEGAIPASPGAVALAAEGVTKRFGGVAALSEVSFRAASGEITAIIGPNGSGKTTLLNVISAVHALDAGSVELGGSPLPARRHVVAARGVARTFQNPMVLADRSVLENVLAGSFLTGRASFLESMLGAGRAPGEIERARALATETLRESGLGSIAARPAGEISLSHQRQVEIVRSLAMRPGLLLLDEPCAGLMGVEVEQLAALLRRVRDAGYSVILVEHNMSLVMTLANHVVVLDQGRVLAAGTPSQVQASPAVVAAYLGTPDES